MIFTIGNLHHKRSTWGVVTALKILEKIQVPRGRVGACAGDFLEMGSLCMPVSFLLPDTPGSTSTYDSLVDWGAMFIDPRSFKHYDEYDDAFGVIPSPVDPCYWDTTSARKQRRTSTSSIPSNANLNMGSNVSGFDDSDAQDMEPEEVFQAEINQSQETDEAQPSASPGSSTGSESSSDDEDGSIHPAGWITWPSLDITGRSRRKSYCQITGLGNLFLFNQVSSKSHTTFYL
jgi:hypothetical protein